MSELLSKIPIIAVTTRPNRRRRPPERAVTATKIGRLKWHYSSVFLH